MTHCYFVVSTFPIINLSQIFVTHEAEVNFALWTRNQIDFIFAPYLNAQTLRTIGGIFCRRIYKFLLLFIKVLTIDHLLFEFFIVSTPLITIFIEGILPAQSIFLEMIILVYVSTRKQVSPAIPTKFALAIPAEHHAAPDNFLNGNRTRGTLLGQLLYIQQIHLFLHKILRLLYQFLIVFNVCGCRFAALKWVKFVRTAEAKFEVAIRALAKALLFVDFGRFGALSQRTPPKVVHLIDCFANWKFCGFFDEILRETDLSQITFQDLTFAGFISFLIETGTC